MTAATAPVRPAWLAVDWGTSHVRVWAMSGDGQVLDEARSNKGMGKLPPSGFEPALLELAARWELPARLQVYACGMVGARTGWAEADYAAVPCEPAGTAPTRAPASDPRLDVRILPGLSQSSPPDIMRGEETQIAGFLADEPDFDGVLCLPGSHSKWCQISAGEVVSFRTVMTGELFAALSSHSVLRHTVGGWDDAAFVQAVDDAIAKPEMLAARLFGLRAAAILDGLSPARSAGRLSGLLIGAELAAQRPYWLGQDVVLIGAPALSQHYAAALRTQGLTARLTRGDHLTRTGLTAARNRWKDLP